MASGNVRGRRLQKVTSNRKKFKKHLTDEYELWEELNGTALSEIYESCTQSIQLLIGKKESATEVWKQLESSFAVSGFASVEQQILKLQELSYSSCKSLQDFTAKEHLEALSIQLPQAYYIVQLLRGPVRYAYEIHAREMHAREMHAREMHAHEVHAYEMYACEVHAHEVHAYEAHSNEMYAHEVHVHETYAYETHA
jgi:hypothetical protein